MWISVEDRLPEFSQRVLVYWRPIDHEERPFHREIITAARTPYDEDGKHSFNSNQWWANGKYYDTETFIIHWQPLPEPPESE